MIIRNYKPSDCTLIARLFYDTVHAVNAIDYTNEQLNAWATGVVDLHAWNRSFLEHNTLVAVIDEEIVGFSDMDNTGYLDRLYVHKDFQRRGIANALVNELEARGRKSGLFSFETHASITSKPFFEKNGYTVKSENEVIRDGIKLLNYRMVK